MGIGTLLWRSTHPGPTLVVTVLAVALGIAAHLDGGRLALLAVAVFLGQVSIGLSNDLIDRERDRATGRHDKPLAAEGAPLRIAWVVAAVAVATALALSAVLSWQCSLVHALFLACGWAYNAGLKATVLSAACFLVGFGAFPSLAPLAAEDPAAAPAWAWVAGGLLGISVHFSNVLPDLDDDARTGVRGLPHRFGTRGAALVAFAALTGGALTVAVASAGPAPLPIAWIAFAIVLAVAVWGASTSLTRAPGRNAFRLVMFGALVLAGMLVLGALVSP